MERLGLIAVWAVFLLGLCFSAEGAPITFEDVDGNRDGKITSDEMYVFVQHEAFTQLDGDGDWIITRMEWDKSEPKDHPRIVKFSDLDVNADAKVTAIEFAGSLSKRQVLDNLFRTLDRNGDGLLTKKELEAKPTREPRGHNAAKKGKK
jgi:Ca2+-binding EF-hand superfamily protein